MSALTHFKFPETGQVVGTTMVNGEPWFFLDDACEILAVRTRDAMSGLPQDEKMRDTVAGTLRDLVSEPGLYRLIFKSRKAGAEAFKTWVVRDVLPEIRQTGSYSVPSASVQLSPRELAQLVIVEADRADAAEAKVAELAPAAEHWTVLASGDGDYAVADAAKILSRDPLIKIGRDRLFTVLDQENWIYRQQVDGKWRTYQRAIDAGRLSEIPQSHYHPRTGELVLDPPQVRVTPKGIADLRVLLGGTVPLAITDSEGL
jgi:prophage antirepressor-like protein